MFCSELLELRDELPVAAQDELRLDPLLERGQPDLLQPLDRDPGEGLVCEVGERITARVTNNSARAFGPSGSVDGGGIWNGQFVDGLLPQLTLTNSRVTGNALIGSAGLTVQGGGLFTAFPVILQHSKIKDNTPDQCFGC